MLFSLMAADPEARKVTVNYTGGSIHMTVGALKSLLGPAYEDLVSTPEEKTVEKPEHFRTRVIGGPTTKVRLHSYTYTKWPTSQSGLADGGSVVFVSWAGSDGEWTARVTGSFADFGSFLQTNGQSPVFFRSQRGTKYGPF